MAATTGSSSSDSLKGSCATGRAPSAPPITSSFRLLWCWSPPCTRWSMAAGRAGGGCPPAAGAAAWCHCLCASRSSAFLSLDPPLARSERSRACHLQDALIPTELAAIPPGILAAESGGNHHSARQQQRLICGRYAERAIQHDPGDPQASAWLGMQLSHRKTSNPSREGGRLRLTWLRPLVIEGGKSPPSAHHTDPDQMALHLLPPGDLPRRVAIDYRKQQALRQGRR